MQHRFLELRKSLGLTQEEFANKLGLTRGAITNVERGLTEPKPHFLSLVANTFNVNEEWLRTGEGEMFRPEDRENVLFQWVGTVLSDESESFRRRFLNLLVNLTPEDWQRAEAFTRSLISPPPEPEEPPGNQSTPDE